MDLQAKFCKRHAHRTRDQQLLAIGTTPEIPPTKQTKTAFPPPIADQMVDNPKKSQASDRVFRSKPLQLFKPFVKEQTLKLIFRDEPLFDRGDAVVGPLHRRNLATAGAAKVVCF